MTITWERLHDVTLVRIEVIWDTGAVDIELDAASGPAHIKVTGLWKLEVPWQQPWGHSVSINRRQGSALPDGKHHRLEIEMQSGDTIVLEAANFQLVDGG